MSNQTYSHSKNIILRTQQRSASVRHKQKFKQKIAHDLSINGGFKQLKYYLGKGNNDAVVRRVLSSRINWIEQEDSTSTFVNFKWQQDQKGFKYNRLIDSHLYRCLLNQLQFHDCLCNKELLFKNLSAYTTKNNIDLYRIVPPTFVLNAKDQHNMQSLKQFLAFYQKHCPEKISKGIEFPSKMLKTSRKLKSYFFNCNLKKNLIMKQPPLEDIYLDEQVGEYLWIVKPSFLNRGRGIQVFSKLQNLERYIEDNVIGYFQKSLVKTDCKVNKIIIDYVARNLNVKQQLPKIEPRQRKEQMQSSFDGNQYIRIIPKGPIIIRTDCFIVQKYLEKPLLINNRKFDIRMWVLITQNLKCYVFRQGYVRLASLQYSSKVTKDNSFTHLTNNAIQRFSDHFGQVADGNQMSLKKLRAEMETKNLDYDKCMQRIYSHIKVSLNAVWKKLNPQNRRFMFEIFGYDFMVDEKGHSWLIQVNNNPCLNQSSQLLKQLIPRLLDDAFKLTIDKLFYGSFSTEKFPVQGYHNALNMWFDLQLDNLNTK